MPNSNARSMMGGIDSLLASGAMQPPVHLGPKVIVTGWPGSGKTVLGQQLGSLLNRRLIRLDPIVLDDRVRRRPAEVISAALNEVAKEDEWVLEGFPWDVPQHAWNTATAVIWLELPKALRAWRLFKRGFPRWLLRRQMWGGIRYAFMAPAAEAVRWRRFVLEQVPASAALIPVSSRTGTRDLLRAITASR
jgi:adenylate kinase family enzyme